MVLAVHYALNQKYANFEIIVSDNSTTAECKERNRFELEKYIEANKLLLVSPSRELSAPEHFEFALQYATGDYVLFLTDKMILLSETLNIAAEAITKSGAEIINWTFIDFITNNYLRPFDSGRIVTIGGLKSISLGYKEYDPLKELTYKSRGFLPRSSMKMEDYVKGKICFGCFSKELISRIISKSGSLFGGATHDYSAMVQALCLAAKCIILDAPGIIFISLPIDKSWGSLTHIQTAFALRYYQAFTDPDLILGSLLVPGLYASSHNMVAHDYVKYLNLYGKYGLFFEKFWFLSIGNDLYLSNKVWTSEAERYSQCKLFFSHLNKKLSLKIYYYYKQTLFNILNSYALNCMLEIKSAFFNNFKLFIKYIFLSNPLGQKILDMRQKTSDMLQKDLGCVVIQCSSLEAAIKLINDRHSGEYLERNVLK